MKVSLQDIANAAGCSVATVSRALRRNPRIPPSTTEKIHQIAQEMGYIPDARMKELMAYMRSSRQRPDQPVLACILDVPLPLPANWSLLGSYRYLVGALEQARQLGYQLELFSLREPGLTHQRLSSILYHRGINGVLIGPMDDAGAHLGIRWEHFATVAIGHSLAAPSLHRISADQVHTTRLCYTKARDLGYQRIGLAITDNLDRRTNFNLRAGYLTEQSLLGNEKNIPPFILQPGEQSNERFHRWLREEKPDVVIYGGSDLKAIEWITEAGLRIPEEIGLIMAGLSTARKESGVSQQIEAVGAAAIDLLVSEIYGNRRGIPPVPKLVLLECLWREGTSTRVLADSTFPSQ